MKIKLKKIKVRDLVEDYFNDLEEGVVGYGGKLDIRPAYQREFVYNDKQQQAVIDTITKGFPLNVMYWAVNKDEDGEVSYEIIDGQQHFQSVDMLKEIFRSMINTSIIYGMKNKIKFLITN